jgi:hypothetical protein
VPRCVLIQSIIALAGLFFVFSGAHSQSPTALLREEFNSLENWRPLYFQKISRHSTYTVERNGEESSLKAESDTSASAIIYRQEFNVYDYPNVRWRWKINNVYLTTDPETKSGDDYPIRIYIIFKYNPEKADSLEGFKYGIAKKLYGEYPPHSTLSYVWANNEGQKTIVTSPYTDKARLIALKKGGKRVGLWQTEEVNILSDYKKAFGTNPPEVASLAIMNDSDNTGQASVSYLDFIEVFRDGG